ncbi:PldB domain-containing protein [Histoplasma capsulatum var. duboisii H88]|uniref:PldB domain-containing protein n=2 Tax=Ajellomyces capsulatus TaxID=5037 RepID=A0A8A1L8E9_AJEC8|nr:PldB domain-containing protein [Histoplasma capsulatum var. duboisii H88]
MASPIDPMLKTYSLPAPQVSKKLFPIAGILCSVYGLDELPMQAKEVSCLYLMHPRLSTADSMEGFACHAIADWNNRLREGRVSVSQQNRGLIAVAFDQRNHGSRLVDKLSNCAWKEGNPKHAQDMFATYQGTARDVSLLIDFMDAYAFPDASRKITTNLALGVSLGGHSVWSCLLHEPRVTNAVIIIGTPDYTSLMTERAKLSKLSSWKDSTPPGSQFLGSESFPQSLMDAIRKYDPARFFLSQLGDPIVSEPMLHGILPEPTDHEKKVIGPLITRCLQGKRIMLISGGKDKLVPYARGEPFLMWLKKAISPGGWFANGAVTLEDLIFEDAGHEVTPAMMEQAIRFIGETLATCAESAQPKVLTSKI